LRKEFLDEEFRNVYADDSLNAHIGTQIKVLREQQKMTQSELAEKTGMAQPRIAVLEDVNYSSWSINTLRRLARAFGLRLSVSFETFSGLIPELETFGRPVLERTRFEDDAFFHEVPAVAAESNLVNGEIFQIHKHHSAAASQPRPNESAATGIVSHESAIIGSSITGIVDFRQSKPSRSYVAAQDGNFAAAGGM
jgi:transcriptional regulator with XRE-family HTH domain